MSQPPVGQTQSIAFSELKLGIHTKALYLQGGPKMAQNFYTQITMWKINRFLNFFHCRNQEKIFSNTVTKGPTTPHLVKYQCF